MGSEMCIRDRMTTGLGATTKAYPLPSGMPGSPMATSSTPPEWVLACPREALPVLEPLAAAHAAQRPVRFLLRDSREVPPLAELLPHLDQAAGLLLVGDHRRAPRTVLPGPFLTTAQGRQVPAGWLPMGRPESLARFAATATESSGAPGRRGRWPSSASGMTMSPAWWRAASASSAAPPVPLP